MKNFILFLSLVSLVHFAYGQGDAPPFAKGQSQATKTLSSILEVENYLATKTSSSKTLLETGNANILANPNFEHSTFSTSWTLTAGSSAVETTIVVSGKKSYKATLSAQTLALYQDSTLYASQFAGTVQGVAMVRVRSTVSGIFVCPRQAGATVLTNCVQVDTTGTWGLYKVPFVLGATSNGVAIVSGTISSGLVTVGNVTGDVFIDDAFVGAADLIDTSNEVKFAGESYFAGTANCTWSRTSTTVGAFTSDVDCPGPTIVKQSLGSWSTTDSDLPRQTITNLPAGTYKATFYVAPYGTAGTHNVISINDGTTTCEAVYANADMTRPTGVPVSCVFTYTSSGARVFELYGAAESTNTVNIQNLNVTPRQSVKFQLEYYGSNSTYSASCGANCVDTFSAVVSGAGVVSSENSDWINGNASIASTSQYTLTFNSGVFTVAPTCVLVARDAAARSARIYTAATTSTIVVRTQTPTTDTADTSVFEIFCRKTGADFTATRTIVGSFKDVVTTPSTTWAALPSATSVTAYRSKYFVTDYPGVPQEVYSDGTNWKTVNQAILGYTRETGTVTTTSITEVILKNYLFPAGFFKVGDYIVISVHISKDNSTNSQNSTVRMGTAGTTADTLLVSTTSAIAGGTMNVPHTPLTLYIASATTVELAQGATLTTTTRTITIPNISNALYLDFGISNNTNTATVVSLEGHALTVIK